jgi:hypothetical protein
MGRNPDSSSIMIDYMGAKGNHRKSFFTPHEPRQLQLSDCHIPQEFHRAK